MKKVTVYSTSTCPYCIMLTKWLSTKKIAYDEYKVDKNPIAAQAMVSLSGQMGVPFTTIEDADGITKILGFDVPKLRASLNV